MKDPRELYLLTLKPGVMDQMFTDELPEVVRNIDVTVLSRLIFMEIFGFDQFRHDNEKLIAYSSTAKDAIDAVDTGKHDIAFIMNSTKIQQVRKIAEAGLVMPRKATYFFPKVTTGQGSGLMALQFFMFLLLISVQARSVNPKARMNSALDSKSKFLTTLTIEL